MNPASALQHWTVVPADAGRSTLQVELQRPLAAGKSARVMLRLHRSPPSFAVTHGQGFDPSHLVLTFPDVVPLSVRTREGVLAISVDPAYQASVETSQTFKSHRPHGGS